MPLKDRRGEYSWPATKGSLSLTADQKEYSLDETIKVNAEFRIVGGLREAFHPDVWTVSWEDFDKILRLTYRMSVRLQKGIRPRKLAEVKKAVRRASFYWSRDPDLPYRIWVMVMPEDGGPPKIPRNVEDAKSKMMDIEREFAIPAAALGQGKHKIVGEAAGKWGRRSFIEKGKVEASSKGVVVEVE